MSKASQQRTAEREQLLAELEAMGYLTDPLVEEAMLDVPRHVFVPPNARADAYNDGPLPIGFGQTISAPHMVAIMTSALQLTKGQSVLEIGTGNGYHAGVLKAVVGDAGTVDSIEYLPELAHLARQNLATANLDVTVHEGDGALGLPGRAPFDAIIVTCAIPVIPDALIAQLADGGHIVAPVGITQCDLIVGRKKRGVVSYEGIGSCLFVNAQGLLADEAQGEHPFADHPDHPDDEDEDEDDDGGYIIPPPLGAPFRWGQPWPACGTAKCVKRSRMAPA